MQESIIITIKPPIYLGVDSDGDTKIWCFIAVKEGVGRFVRYIKYPMWSKGSDMPDMFNIRTPPPEDVLNDVELFIEGKATFHELPPKQGRKRRVIKTLVEATGDHFDVSGGVVESREPVQRKRRAGGTGLGSVPSTPVQDGTSGASARGRLRSTDLQKSSRGTPKLVETSPGVFGVKYVPPKDITMEPVKGPEVVGKKPRGRPRKVI